MDARTFERRFPQSARPECRRSRLPTASSQSASPTVGGCRSLCFPAPLPRPTFGRCPGQGKPLEDQQVRAPKERRFVQYISSRGWDQLNLHTVCRECLHWEMSPRCGGSGGGVSLPSLSHSQASIALPKRQRPACRILPPFLQHLSTDPISDPPIEHGQFGVHRRRDPMSGGIDQLADDEVRSQFAECRKGNGY